MKNKKIIFEATAIILGTIIILSFMQVSSAKNSEGKYKNLQEPQQNNNMIFFGLGNIGSLTIDGEYDLKGVISGNITIENTGSGTYIPYFILTKDIVNNKIKLKWALPEDFILTNFSGIGKIYYYQAPHGPDWTEFFLIGSFEEIIIK